MATKSTKKLIDEERKPLVVGKSPEIKPGSSGSGPGSPGSPGAPTKDSKKSYQTMPSSEPSKTASGPSASSAESAGGYQSSPGPSTSDPSTPVASRSSLARQIFLGTVIALPSVPCGMSLAFSAVTFDSLNLSVEAASWYASVTIMSFPFGGLLVGQLMDQYGRKPALLSITVVSLIGWLMLSVPSSDVSLAKLIIGRILTGVAGGLASVPAAVYAAECLCPNNVKMRSSLVTWSTVALSIGIFLVYICGAFLVYYNVASIATLISLLALVLVAIFIPESPVWLASKGRHGDAEWSEREIAIAPPPVLMEEPSASEWEDSPKPQPPPPPPETSTFSELKKPEVYKPLLIMVGFLFFQQFSGVYVVIAYMVDIIRAAGVVTVNAYWLSIVGGAVIVCVAILASFIYPKTGVRAIAALSSFGTAITMFWIGIFLSTRHLWVGNSKLYFLNWIPVILIISNIALSTSGFLILPWSMLGEVFPLNIKGVAAGIATCLGFTFSFIVLKVYPYIQLGFGVSEVFYFFGLMALLGSMFVVAFLPETHGKTLQEIIDEFTKKKSKPGKTTENTSSVAEKQPEPPKKAEKKTEKKSEKKPSTAEKDFKKAEIQV